MTLISSQAQDGYVKFNNDISFKGGATKVYNGEVLPYIKSIRPDSINIIVNTDTISFLPLRSQSYSESNTNNDYRSKKNVFIKVDKRNGDIIVNVKSIPAPDQVILISKYGKRVLELNEKRKAKVPLSECGKTFRLIIMNSPTIFYTYDNLDPYVKTMKDLLFSWWVLLIMGLFISGVGIALWNLFFRRKIKSIPDYVEYPGNKGLSDFANDHGIDLDRLIKLNKKVIDPKYKSFSDKDKKNIQRELKGEKLIIGYKSSQINLTENSTMNPLFGSKNEISDFDDYNKFKVQNENEPAHDDENNLPKQLKRMEINILDAIRLSSSRGKDYSTELEKLNRELTDIKNIKIKLENEKSTILELNTKIINEKEELLKRIQATNIENEKNLSDLNQLQEKVVSVDYLTGYCESVLDYFHLCNEITLETFSQSNRISQKDIKEGFPFQLLISNFYNSIANLPIGQWVQVLEDIKDTGLTNNKKIKSSFKQITTNDDRKKQFQQLLFAEVLVKYTSSILILAEAFRNIGHFQTSSETNKDIQNVFEKYVSEITNRARTIGIEVKYVPLFKNFEDYLGQIESIDNKKSPVYSEVKGLDKDSIAEIVSYGVRTLFEDSKTLIILA
jgi:hypothetical protein